MNSAPYKLANGKTRARAGMGKTPWGITKAQQQRIIEIRSDPNFQNDANFRQFIYWIEALISSARDMAACGKKNEARYIHRCLTNARVVSILESQKFIEKSSFQEFKKSLQSLGEECHPLHVPDLSSDLAAIRSHLETLLVQNGKAATPAGLMVFPMNSEQVSNLVPVDFKLSPQNATN